MSTENVKEIVKAKYVDTLMREVEGKFISAFVRATKPANVCCAPGCCS